jgi:hypothetical protein
LARADDSDAITQDPSTPPWSDRGYSGDPTPPSDPIEFVPLPIGSEKTAQPYGIGSTKNEQPMVTDASDGS